MGPIKLLTINRELLPQYADKEAYHREYAKAYRKSEEGKAKCREYYLKNKEKRDALRKESYWRNVEKEREKANLRKQMKKDSLNA
jgi:type III secretory pathway component EscR